MKLLNKPNFSNFKSLDELARFLDQFSDDILSAINGNLLFDKNVNTKSYTVKFTSANVEVATTHDLGKVPSGYIVTSSTVACSVYNGSTANTNKAFYLKSDTPATIGILLF